MIIVIPSIIHSSTYHFDNTSSMSFQQSLSPLMDASVKFQLQTELDNLLLDYITLDNYKHYIEQYYYIP